MHELERGISSAPSALPPREEWLTSKMKRPLSSLLENVNWSLNRNTLRMRKWNSRANTHPLGLLAAFSFLFRAVLVFGLDERARALRCGRDVKACEYGAKAESSQPECGTPSHSGEPSMFPLAWILLLCTSPFVASQASDLCTTLEGKRGQCRPLVRCVRFISEVNALRRRPCPLSNGEDGVCCPHILRGEWLRRRD